MKHQYKHNNQHKNSKSPGHSLALMTAAALSAVLLAPAASAEITEDCILEGTVDMRRAEQLGQPVYVKFRSARRGSEAGCSMSRRSDSRRVQFISAPDTRELTNVDVEHGDRVRYRYIERDHQHGSWELVTASDS
jgi:hypothetical protein